MNKDRVALIGSGLAGLVCCRYLQDNGFSIQCFEKSGRAGGRASTRIAEPDYQFDHGAQYFTIRDPKLKPMLEAWRSTEHVREWEGRVVAIDELGVFRDLDPLQRFVGSPCMNSLGAHLAENLSISFHTEVAQVDRIQHGYRLFGKSGQTLGEFETVLMNAPPLQVENLLPALCSWRSDLSKVSMVPCWAVMIALEHPWHVPFDGAFVNQGNLSWMARDSSKPNRRKTHDTWVLHSSVQWASEHLELPKEEVISTLILEAERATNHIMPPAKITMAHRWLYSRPVEALPDRCLWDATQRLGACGDWCGGPRVEGAIQSGLALAGRVLGQ